MSTLYRRYRPQTFAEVVGQPHIIDTLRQAIVKDRLSHAYLLFGPRGTGKTTTARLLAKRVNCLKADVSDPEPCTTCELCVAAQENRHLDIVEIDAASNRGIDDIRSLREAASSRPALGKRKVYIIDEVHMLTNEAFAALLKMLEEPQAHILFILATTELHKVPATIASRCQVFRFRRATGPELKGRLRSILQQERRVANDEALDLIISRADGCYRDAESLLGLLLSSAGKLTRDSVTDTLGLPPPALIESFLEGLVANESAPALAALDAAFAGGFDPEQFIKESLAAARNGALAAAKNEADRAAFARHAQALTRLPLVIRALIQAMQDLAFVPQPLMALELVVLSLCSQKGRVSEPAAPVQAPQATPIVAAPAAAVTVEQVLAVWPQAIQAMRDRNPVASTFLRAVEPRLVEGAMIVLNAHYALHRTFFEKPEQKEALSAVLSKLLEQTVTVRCELDAQDAAAWKSAKTKAETDLYEAAKAVFTQ